MKSRQYILAATVCAVLPLLFVCTLNAQIVATAQVSGTIQDASGAAIADAAVQITQTSTGLVRTAVSAANGAYTIPNLPVGPYRLQVTKQGFNTFVQEGIELEVASNPTINVSLRVGTVTQEVTVTGNAAVVETHNGDVGQVIDQKRIVDLPLNGRDAMQLALLSGGTTLPGSQSISFNGSREYPVAYQISFAGRDAGTGTYFLDGANHNDPGTNIQQPLPFPDALQEFKVEESAVPARYGMHSGGTVNAVTKSGTNAFHGDAFEYVRNYIFNARNYFAATRDNLKRNQFGGVLGGPIRKDKMFFFGGFQYTSLRSNSPTNIDFIPTPAMLSGDFTAAQAAGCSGFPAAGLATSQGFAGNKIAPSLFSQPSVTLANLFLAKNTPSNACGEVVFPIATDDSAPIGVGKFDYNINDKHTASVRYLYAGFSLPADNSNILASTGQVQTIRFSSLALNETYLVSANMINAFTAGVNRGLFDRTHANTTPSPSALGVQDFYNPVPNLLDLTNSGFFNLAGLNQAYFNTTTPQITNDLSILHGSHQFSFGVNWNYFIHNSGEPAYANGTFNFSNSFTGYALADFLLGDLASTSYQANTVYIDINKTYLALYAQDSWKLNSRLTLNYGIRWEPAFPWAWSRNTSGPSHFSESSFLAGMHSTARPLAPAGLTFPGDAGYPGNKAAAYTEKLRFVPRIGLAFDPRGKGQEVIRLAYGILYDFDSTGEYYNASAAPPWGDEVPFPNDKGGFTNPWLGYQFNGTVGNPYPIPPSAPFPTYGQYVTRPLHPPSLYTQQWNVAFQKQLGQEWMMTLSYLGNETTHIIFPSEGDPAVYIAPGNCGLASPTAPCSTTANTNTRRTLYLANQAQGQYFASIVSMEDDRNADYNGAIATIQKRFTNDLGILANYTYSHCIDEYELGSAVVYSVWANPAGKNAERGNCTFDRRQIFNASGLLQTPQLRSSLLRAITENWQLSPIITYATGDWLTVTTGADTALVGITAGQRPNLAGNPRLSQHSAANKAVKWFNTSAFALPSPGSVGNLGRGILEGPNSWDVDTSLTRTFKIYEQHQLQVRADAFNVFNHTRWPDPTTTMNSGTFGEITASSLTSSVAGAGAPQDPRIMQFALKYLF